MEKRQLKAAESEQVGPGRQRPSGCNPGFRDVAQVPTGPRERPLSVWEGLTCTVTQFNQAAHPSRTQGQTRPPEREGRGGGPGSGLGGQGCVRARVSHRVPGTWGRSGVFRSAQGACVGSRFPAVRGPHTLLPPGLRFPPSGPTCPPESGLDEAHLITMEVEIGLQSEPPGHLHSQGFLQEERKLEEEPGLGGGWGPAGSAGQRVALSVCCRHRLSSDCGGGFTVSLYV